MSLPPAVVHISEHILKHVEKGSQKKPLFVAVQGPQGSGKSYLTGLVHTRLCQPPYSLRVATLSLDDLYLMHEDLVALSANNPGNPLWRGRGQPGTHDIPLGERIFASLKRGDTEIELPRFEKSLFNGEGDRLPLDGTGIIVKPPLDVVVVEGWCTGFCPIPDEEIDARWNGVWKLEKEKLGMDDSIVGNKENIKQVNEVLRGYVDHLWSHFDVFVHIVPAPSNHSSMYSVIYEWRLQQEHNMKAMNGGKGMSDEAVKLFVDRYIPGYVFFGDGVRVGTANSSTPGEVADATAAQSFTPPWLGKSLRVILDRERTVLAVENF